MGVNPLHLWFTIPVPVCQPGVLQNCLDYLINPSDLSEAKAKKDYIAFARYKKINEQRVLWQLVNIAAPIALVFIVAVIYQWRRKRKIHISNDKDLLIYPCLVL